MATTSKLSFRARNLDANRGMKVFFADELPDITECTPIARGVNPMPTGMEKEEEMETHLQHAIHAQQASTSGISGNHVIPTPKVLYIDQVRYDQVYPVQPPCKAQLMKVQAWLSMEREEAEYDMDSEDEEYLRDKPHIHSRDLERIMETLEAQSSESAICQPASARKLLMPHFDDNVIDDVYDYWLAKRKDAATNKILGFGGLIPRIRTECRKENEKLNPYVAFRRRAEKMQTRKNRKNDEDSYEKVLRLGHDLRRAVHLFEMVKRREKSKLAMLDLDAEILSARAQLGDYGSVVYNQILAKLVPADDEDLVPTAPERVPANGAAAAAAGAASAAAAGDGALQPLREENGVRRKKMRKRVSGLRTGLGAAFDRELPNKAWLKKNAEVWNQSPAAFISGMSNYSPAVEQVDQSVAAANTANADGRYAFKRRRGCQYRSAISLKAGSAPRLESIPSERRFYFVGPSTSKAGGEDQAASASASLESTSTTAPAAAAAAAETMLLRRRIGRGGRVIFDRFPQPKQMQSAATAATPQRSNYVAGRGNAVIYDPFELDCVAMGSAETSRWTARQRPVLESEDEMDSLDAPISSRYLHSARHRAAWSLEDEAADADAEAAWLASAVSPSPSPTPPQPPPSSAAAAAATSPPPAKRMAPSRPEEDDEDSSGDCSPPSEHEDAPAAAAAAAPLSALMKAHLSDVIEYGSNGSSKAAAAAAAARNTVVHVEELSRHHHHHHHDDSMMDEVDVASSSTSSSGSAGASPIEVDSPPSSSSEQDHHEDTTNSSPDMSPPNDGSLHPLGVVGVAAKAAAPVNHHHHHLQQQLQLTQGNASVLSPPDSTAPSPRVSSGSNGSNGSSAAAAGGEGGILAGSVAPNNGHGHGLHLHPQSGNGSGRGYEMAASADDDASSPATDADAWRVRAKLVTTMEAVASRLVRVKDPDASSRESGCSPTEKSLPSSMEEDGVVVQLVEPWREPSNSPSDESNSSSDWTPPNSTRSSGDVVVVEGGRLAAYATLSSEEETGARTGDHPTLPAKPLPRKQNGATTAATTTTTTVQLAALSRSSFAPLGAATSTPSPVV